ncbi:ABC transporter ATP-binding protein [Corticimicrobacter populi]|uniref:ABC transporter ATP-binding protein n=1 Tax=Corticimicrobacter populi TaxID=2175229 RepID=A0A2V1K6X4_9BURK|nr:ABC transporter ATP-binding protein [Corticimicrobacter populi]
MTAPADAPIETPVGQAQAAGVVLEVSDLAIRIASEDSSRAAVEALALCIRRGETFALVGESGCGKSLTALALLRLLPETVELAQGSIRLAGEELTVLAERDMRNVRGGQIGMIFQEPSTSLNPVMTVGRQVVEVVMRHTPLRGEQARNQAIRWLDRVGIPDAARRLDDYPFQFSGGQKQRIMIAMALAGEPALLIADEPTTALDVTIQAQILSLLADIQRELGMAILLITHDLAVVRQVAHQVALMRHGRIVDVAPVGDFFEQTQHPYAQELFDAIPGYEKRGRPLSAAGRKREATPVFAEVLDSGVVPKVAMDMKAVQTEASAQLPALLQVQDLKVHYPVRKGLLRREVATIRAVDGVSFELRQGRTLALLGGSGCGKTTTAKAMLRLLDGQARISGKVLLDGQSVLDAGRASMKTLRRRIQIVFQDPFASLDPRMRVGEILDEGLASLRRDLPVELRRQRIAGLLERVGLPADTQTRYPHEFSGGQRQRIAIARALATEPDVLVCDEPTSALDVSVQAQIIDLLQELQRELGMAYLFVSHNFGVVEYLADDIAVMAQGRIVEIGPAEQVLLEPRHEETRQLLAAVPRLDARLP